MLKKANTTTLNHFKKANLLLHSPFPLRISIGLLVITLLMPLSAVRADIVDIGVLNLRNTEADKAFWAKTAQWLSKEIPNHQFVIKSMGPECLTHAINKQQLDFAITNPSQIVALEKTDDVHPIATLQTRYETRPYSHFGAALITRADRSDLKRLSDLKGQSVMAVSPSEFGGYQMIWRELQLASIAPKKDFFNLLFTNGSQEAIIRAIINEEADIGIIRSGLIESLLDQNKLPANQIKVIHPQHTGPYPLLHSSILYPEWSMIRLAHTDIALARQVSRTLQTMPKSTAPGTYNPHYGWTRAEDFTTVHGLLRALKLPPYEPSKQISLKAILQEHGLAVGLIVVLILMLSAFSARMSRINRKLAVSQSELAKHRDNLEKEVADRTVELSQVNQALEQDIEAREKVEDTLRRSRAALQGVYEISVDTRLPQSEKLLRLIQLARRHFRMDAAFLYKLPDGPHPALSLCVSDGDIPEESKLKQCLESHLPEFKSQAILQFSDTPCAGQVITFTVQVNGQPHCVLVFVGQNIAQWQLAEVDEELLRLITQWIGSSIERQDIETEHDKYRTQLGKVTRLFTVGEMASGLAHEINQPLTAATNYISGSLRRLDDSQPSHLKTGLTRSLESLDRATNIIRRLREFVQTGARRQEAFQLNATLKRVLSLLDSEAKQHAVTLIPPSLQGDVCVVGDPVQIEQVLLNLIRNAIDACDENGCVSVDIHPQTDTARILVSDTGPGIPEKDLPHVFDAFHSSKSDGMGLGLAICRSIVEAHHGQLHVCNTHEGAQFMFELPLCEAGKARKNTLEENA